MARQRFDDSATKISLFPFLDALSGVIGILALIISTIAALNMKEAKLIIEHPHNEQRARPVYVECCADGLLLHPEKRAVSLEQVRNSETAWNKLLREIQSSSDTYLILLIRPDGIDTFYEAKDQALNAGIDLGYDALSAEGEVEIQSRQMRGWSG